MTTQLCYDWTEHGLDHCREHLHDESLEPYSGHPPNSSGFSKTKDFIIAIMVDKLRKQRESFATRKRLILKDAKSADQWQEIPIEQLQLQLYR